jgi:hypothetical protein
MAKVFQVVEIDSTGSFISWVTENGKVLQTRKHFESGLESMDCIDPCVDFPESNWGGCGSVIADLYWLFECEPYSVTEVEYPYTFKEPEPTKSRIGDRKVVNPADIA